MNFEVARYSDGITATSHDFALFQEGIPIFPISKDQLKEYKKTKSIAGVIKDGALLIEKYDFETHEKAIVNNKKEKASRRLEVPKKDKIEKEIKREVFRKKSENNPYNENDLSDIEIEELFTLSKEQINRFHPTMKGFLKNQLLLIRNDKNEIKSYHAKLLWGLIQEKVIDGKAVLGNVEMGGMGLSSSVIKKARNELLELGLISCSQEIINSRARNVYKVL